MIEPGSDYYGNNVTLRGYYLPSGARKSWLDHNVQLPAGTLVAFYVYAHNIIVVPSTTGIDLQIWRPTVNDRQFTLVWQKSVNVSYSSDELYNGFMYTVSMSIYMYSK